MACECRHWACALPGRSGFLCHSSSSTPPTFSAFHPPTLPRSLPFCVSISHPSYAPSLPPQAPVQIQFLAVLDMWWKSDWFARSATPPISSSAELFYPFTVCMSVSSSRILPLSSSSLSESVAPLFLLEPHARGRLELCEGRKKKKTKSLLLFLQSGPPRSPPCHRWIFFFFYSLLAGF